MKKLSTFCITLMLVIQGFIVISSSNTVKAWEPSKNVVGLDWEFMENMSENFSNIIYDAYDENDEIHKGRAFGSKGEVLALKYMGDNFTSWNIDNQEDKIDQQFGLFRADTFVRKLNWYVDIVDDKDFIIMKPGPNEIVEDFFITPTYSNYLYTLLWPLRYLKPLWHALLFLPIFRYNPEFGINKFYAFHDLEVYEFDEKLGNDIELIWNENELTINSMIENNKGTMEILSLFMDKMEEKYNFSFAKILLNQTNASELPWRNSTIAESEDDFFFIHEDPSFNPSRQKHPFLYRKFIEDWIIDAIYLERCKGVILYENEYNSENETYNMEYRPYERLPYIFIPRSVGLEFIQNDDYRVSINWNQGMEEVNSHNFVAEIEGTQNEKKTVLIGCLFDGWWSQATCDSAIGMSIVMTVAKYAQMLKEAPYNIEPKHDLKFVGFAGEEAGLRGAFSYETKYRKYIYDGDPEEKHLVGIFLNQLGYYQKFPPQSLYCLYNKEFIKNDEPIYSKYDIFNNSRFIDTINEDLKFKQRVDGVTEFKPIKHKYIQGNQLFANRWHVRNDYIPFSRRDLLIPGWKADTYCIIQENATKPYAGWRQHHRTNLDYSKGDNITLYNESFVNLTAELVWNLTKYFAYNPDCSMSFEMENLYDTDEDGLTDQIVFRFNLDTILPHEKATVVAELSHELLSTPYYKQKHFIIDESGLYTSLTINANEYCDKDFFPKGTYRWRLYLLNSTGDINRRTISKTWYLDKNNQKILRKLANEYTVLHKIKINKDMSLPSVSIPYSSSNQKAGSIQTYYTTGINPSGNQVYYQWEFTNMDNGTTFYTGWLGPYTANQSHSCNYLWTSNGTTKVRVRSRDSSLYHNNYGDWSGVNQTIISKGVGIIAPEKVLVNSSFNVTGIPYGINSSNHTWKWYFDDQQEQADEGQNQSHTYPTLQNNTITLNVNDNSSTYTYNVSIQAVYLYTTFNAKDTTVKPNENITFNSTYFGEMAVNSSSWSWNFGDGNTSSTQNTTHNYSSSGVYNVTVTVEDNQSRSTNYSMQIIVDNNEPNVISAVFTPEFLGEDGIQIGFYPYKVGIGQNITFYMDLYDSMSDISSVYLNLKYPDQTTTNTSMIDDSSDSSDYSLTITDMDSIGPHYYQIWVKDDANNIMNTSGDDYFDICHLFGRSNVHQYNVSIEDYMNGTKYIPIENGTTDSISVYLKANETTDPKARCMIYDGGTLLGYTEEKEISTGDYFEWITFNLTGDNITDLQKDNEYILLCWSDDKCYISYDNASTEVIGYTRSDSYGDGIPPSSVMWPDSTPPPENKFRTYSIYCSYTNLPEIENVSHTPSIVGFGYNFTITTNVTDSSGLNEIGISFDYPNASYNWENESMTYVSGNQYQYVFDDTWWNGQYNYTIWASDIFGNTNSSDEYSFNVSANATIAICTIYDEYQNGTIINLTDPPAPEPEVKYELQDDGETLKLWNIFDEYYINTTSGIQLTNHKDDYWTHNVLMLGYYQNGAWKKLYRTDELTGFTMDIETDNETYVNVTFWKNILAKGYPVRLAIRYHLGGNDTEIMVIPYIKNLAGDIPYQLGFGWELKDIQIDMTTTDDYIQVNNSQYYLNQTVNNSYTNLDDTVFYIMENITTNKSKSLHLRWDNTLNYKLQVKSRTGQYNAPVILFIKIGTLAAGQEKYTRMYWYDADQITYIFNEYDEEGEAWETDPDYMVDGNEEYCATTTIDDDVELLLVNECRGENLGIISKVELRVCGTWEGENPWDIIIRPVHGGTTDGSNYTYEAPEGELSWSDWFDITLDSGLPWETPWTWDEVKELDCDVVASLSEPGKDNTVLCSRIEIRVTYTNQPPVISNPVPTSGSDGVSITPWLNITVDDPNNDNMNINWLTNYSGSWATFASNNSVSDGTYHQNYTNATVNGQWYYWRVNVTDGTNYTLSSIYSFYTGYQSKLVNVGSYDCLGYLYFEIQKYNSTSGNWTYLMEFYTDQYTTNLSSSGDNETIEFDAMINGTVNSSSFWQEGNGTYRFYVAFMNPYFDVLVTEDDRKLEATYEFDITFD